MPNMFNVLYNRYIQQIKLQQILNYNQKHHDYLAKSGKNHNNPQQYIFTKNITKKLKESNQQRAIKPQKQYQHQQEIYNEQSYKQNNRKAKQFSPVRNQNIQKQKHQDNKQKPIRQNQYHQAYAEQQKKKNQQRSIKNKPQNIYSVEQKYDNKLHQKQIKQQSQQRSIKPTQQFKKNVQYMTEYAQQQENVVLQECPQGCGRKFRLQALQKHIKICQKVFQGKRKPFKVDVVDEEAKNVSEKITPNDKKLQKNKTDKVPKWKKQSELLRRGLKSKPQGESNQSIPAQQQDDRVQCNGCGRKFNSDTAQRHIPNCLKRNKQKK